MVPLVLCSPLGGALADRVPRQRIMVILDFFTAALIICFLILLKQSSSLPVITALLMLLSAIQALYQPSVQASIPSLTGKEHLMAANGVVAQVQALASLLGPIAGGFLYAYLGLFPILLASAVCFFASAVLELFLKIPFQKPASAASALCQIKYDLTDALHFLYIEHPSMFRLLLSLAALNLFLSALFTVGLPFLIKTYLGFSSQLYGFAEGALGIGSILGGLLSGILARCVSIHRAHRFLLGTALSLLPMGLILYFRFPALISYGIILFCVLLGMACAVLFNIALQTYMQQKTPSILLGKVASFVSAFCVCALPLGQAMYGGLFQIFSNAPWIVLIFGAGVSLLLCRLTGRTLSQFFIPPA